MICKFHDCIYIYIYREKQNRNYELMTRWIELINELGILLVKVKYIYKPVLFLHISNKPSKFESKSNTNLVWNIKI